MNEKSTDYIDKIRELENEIFDLKADRNAATITEQQQELAEKNATYAKKEAEIERLKVENEWLYKTITSTQDIGLLPYIKELELRIKELTDAVSAHIKVCRGWFGDDHVWEQIIANNEWEGK
jgi:chromosome segregation ATPase